MITTTHQVTVLSTLMLSLIFSFSTHATELIKDSYIVTFKQPKGTEVPIVMPPSLVTQRPIPFGEHSSGQSKKALATRLGLKGEIVRIYDIINAIHIHATAEEAYRLSLNPQVLRVTQSNTVALAQTNPGWALDRLDEYPAPALNNHYAELPYDGTGRTIFVLDTGLDLSNPIVAAEFGGRASVFFDFNGGDGKDCQGHGTVVASVAAGNTYGVAKGATIKAVKMTKDCEFNGNSDVNNYITAFTWLATPGNVPKGTIVSWSGGYFHMGPNDDAGTNCTPIFQPDLENAIKAAHDNGVIIVAAAANDGCNTADFTPTHMPEVFVVGATTKSRISNGQDERGLWYTPTGKKRESRIGWNISVFAPGVGVSAMIYDGTPTYNPSIGNYGSNGTSLATPYIAGLIASGCQYIDLYCATHHTEPNTCDFYPDSYCDSQPVSEIYQLFRDIAAVGTVTDPGGTQLTGSHSRFLSKMWLQLGAP